MVILAAMASGTLAATSGSFDVLSMNVAGLPPVLNGNDVPGDKAANSQLIGSYFAKYDYDVIHVQEVSSQAPAITPVFNFRLESFQRLSH